MYNILTNLDNPYIHKYVLITFIYMYLVNMLITYGMSYTDMYELMVILLNGPFPSITPDKISINCDRLKPRS